MVSCLDCSTSDVKELLSVSIARVVKITSVGAILLDVADFSH